MTSTNKKFFILLLLMAQILVAANQLPDAFKIVPSPKKVEVFSHKGIEFDELESIQLENNIDRPVLGNILSLLPEKDTNKIGKLILKISDAENIPESPEGYILSISDGNVEIASRGDAGLFYGCQTLEQMLEDARDLGISIPSCNITDFPDYTYRSVHFDTKHHLDHVSYYYKSIDRLARYKINAITWEFEDKLGYQTHPLIAAPQAISIDEMAALTRYARVRYVEITPLVQGLGHATFILKHQRYAYMREISSNPWAFCPLHEGGYQVLFDLYREAIKATPGSHYFHIGGDEIGNIGLCERCKPTADEKGKFELNLYWMNRACDFLAEQGRTPVFWSDMPFKYAGIWETTREEKDFPDIWETGVKKLDQIIKRFPENGVFMHWNYTTCLQPGNNRVLEWLTSRDLNTMISTGANSGPAALFPKDDRNGEMSDRGLVAIQTSLQLAYEKGIDGVLTTGWDDRSPHMETYWRGFIASAEYSWTTQGRNLDDFQKSYMQREFGPDAAYTDLYLKLRDAAYFWETSLVRNGNRMETENALLLLPRIHHEVREEDRDGMSQMSYYSDVILDIPDLSHPGDWTNKYKARLENAEKQITIFKSTSQQLEDLYKVSIRNHYHWELYSALNNFQITAPKLLLSLKQCDVSDKSNRKAGFKAVNKALDEFDMAWAELKDVYGETRHIAYPKYYVRDRYFHYASQREDLTWMIQVEELLHKLVREWLNENE